MTNKTKENKKLVFKNYGEYLYMTKKLSNHQKMMIFDSLSRDEKKSLEKALVDEGWDDLIWQNEIDSKTDLIKKIFGKDVIDLKIKVLKGKKIRIKTSIWERRVDEFKSVPDSMKNHIFSGLYFKIDRNDSHFGTLQKGKR
jgi:hypothetical protein